MNISQYLDSTHIKAQHLRFALFSAALFIYAVWGSPTPDNPGIAEIMILVFLAFAIGLTEPVRAQKISLRDNNEKWRLSSVILWIYGLTIPLIMAMVNDSDFISIARDLIGFSFLCLPLFLVHFVKNNEYLGKYFFILGLTIGLVFSLRVVISFFPAFRDSTELLYLANSPLVLMTSLFLAAYAAKEFFDKITLRSILICLMCVSGFLITVAAMFHDLQRAAFAAMIISGAIFLGIGLVKSPLKLFFPIIIFLLGLWLTFDWVMLVLSQIATKTTQVGSNMRIQEWQAVWEMASSSWVSIILGQGWGASFASPAVGGLQVTYTHSLLTYMFFKTGLIGLSLTLLYLLFIIEKLASLYFSNPVKGNALLWPFLIPVLLYASYKSFDFGILLTMILAASLKVQNRKDI